MLFTAGGTGAGKSTAIKNIEGVQSLASAAHIVYDTNMNTFSSADKKIQQALDANHEVHIALVQRDPTDALVNGALPRAMKQEAKFGSGRTVPLDEHLKTHIGAPVVVKRLAEKYKNDPRVQFTAIDNSHGLGNAKVIPLDKVSIPDHNSTEKALSVALEKEYGEGRLSKAVYNGFKS